MGRFVGVTLRAFPFLPTPIFFFSSQSAKTSRQRYAVEVLEIRRPGDLRGAVYPDATNTRHAPCGSLRPP